MFTRAPHAESLRGALLFPFEATQWYLFISYPLPTKLCLLLSQDAISFLPGTHYRAGSQDTMTILPRTLAVLLCFILLFSTTSTDAFAQEEYASLTDSELDAVVAPVALYPDALLAQVLGAATYPDQVVDADNFLKANASLQGDALASAVEAQGWDPAVQALTQFPSVLTNMAKNIPSGKEFRRPVVF